MILAIVLIFSGLAFWRNQLVYDERTRVADIVADRVRKNTSADWRKEWDVYHRYTYDEMMYKFWIPVSRFYADVK